MGYGAPSSGTLTPWGELLVDPSSTRLFHSVAPAAGGLSQHSLPIANDPALIGRVIYTQGLILGRRPLALTNGIVLRLR